MDISMNLMSSLAVAFLIAGTGLVMHGCSKDDVVVVPGNNSSVDEAFGTGQFAQVERVGRPLVLETLVLTNDFLNGFNAMTPDLDIGPAAAPIVAEATATLRALDLADGLPNVDQNGVLNALLPDVMRIDTSLPTSVATSAYDRSFNSLGAPIGGRKLEDDVWDITSKLIVGSTTPDNVTYNRPASGAGSSNPAIGHQMLNGQSVARGIASFPYLAPAN